MKNILTNDFASELFDLSEDSIYNILEEFNENQNIDKTLTYVFIKAFYIHIAKVILDKENISLNFDEVCSKYRMYLSIYYKSNNSQISQELLNEILDAFDKSFAIIESLEFNRIEDSYEFRHHIIDSFELLRKILEKKSKCNIRTDIFDKYIADIQEQSEKINNYIIGLKSYKSKIYVTYYNYKQNIKLHYIKGSTNLSENKINRIKEYCKENIKENKKDKLQFSN